MTHGLGFKRTLLAAAVSLVFSADRAMADEVEDLINPDVSEVGATLFYLSDVNPLYRTYTGINSDGVHGVLDLNLVRRTEEGRWFRIRGRGLGQNNQELLLTAEQQGDWGVRVGYNEIARYAPFEVLTGATGIGSDTLTLAGPPPVEGPARDLRVRRSGTTIELNKRLTDNLQVNFGFKHEDKEGARMSGINGTGYMQGIAPVSLPLNLDGIPLQVFAAEPIDSTHQQFEASLDYTTRTFQITAGYYGSFFRNNAGKLLGVENVAGTALFYSQALAPDNESQNIYVNAAYRFSEATRGTFSVSRAIGKQDDGFVPVTLIRSTAELNPAAAAQPAVLTQRTSLGGKVETTNIAANLSSRITPKLTLNTALSYDEHDDQTPREVYVIDWGHNNDELTNNPENIKTTRGKIEGVYRLPADYRLTVGYDYDQKRYEGMEEEGYRDEVQEDTVRLSVAKTLNDELNGSLAYSHGERDGSSWGSHPTLQNDGSHPTGLFWTAPTQFSDRERDKLRLLLDWAPLRALSIQFAAEYARDDFETRHLEMGLNDRRSELYSVDATYRLNGQWKANAWYSYGDVSQRQNAFQSAFGSTCDGTTFASMIGTSTASTCVPWSVDLKSRSQSAGVGLDGRVSSQLGLGGRLLVSRDVVEYDIDVVDQGPTTTLLSGAGELPDTEYTLTTLRLFANYAFTKATAIRLDCIWDRRELDDYTWSQWSYSDGTRVLVDPKQTTRLFALTVTHTF